MRSEIATRLAGRLATLGGWRRYGLAGCLGIVATLALPPVHALPTLYVGFTGLVWLLPGGLRPLTAFLTGWSWGLGYFVFSLYWIGFAPATFSDSLLWVVPFAAVGLPILLAVFPGVATLAASRLGATPLARVLGLTLCWAATEWLRGHVFTGFPWNLAGYAWVGSDALAQSAALFGMYGVTVLAVAAAALPAVLAEGSRRRRIAGLALALGLPLMAWAGGAIRLADAPAPGSDSVPGVGLRIVQANIPQREKWERRFLRHNFDLHLNLSITDRPDWITAVIWPETAIPFDIADERGEDARRSIALVVPRDGLLLTGAPRRGMAPEKIWNGLTVLDSSGAIRGSFDKFHLVPFGEYMPLRGILPFDKITPGTLDFSPGPGPRTLRLGSLPPFSPLICYEVIFPGNVVAPDDRPSWLLNLTNDAWYGHTAGPHQHLAIARVRAIEEGLPLVRAANTGISAVFDAYGRELGRIDLDTQGILDTVLPTALPATPYARFGDLLFLVVLLVVLLPLLLVLRNDRADKKQ